MRSVYAKILLWCLGGLILALFAVARITSVPFRSAGRVMFEGWIAMETADATQAYESGGRPALAAYLAKLDRYLSGKHYLTDASGTDLVTGEDRSTLLRE